MKIAVVILAGGEGVRMGGNKPRRLLAGRSLLDRAEAQARQWSDRIAVSVRSETQLGESSLELLLDEPGVEGPLAGLIAALRFARSQRADAVLTIPADMPFLPADLADRLVVGLPGAQAAIASSGGHLHPVCGLWHTQVLDQVPGYVASGQRSLKGFAETIGCAAAEWPAIPRDPFFNINRPGDLLAAERLLRD